MNIPRYPLGIRDQRIFLVFGLLLAMVLPVLAYESWDGIQNLSIVEEELAAARKIQAHKQAYMAKVRAYQTFTAEIQQFLQDAKAARVLENDWITYEVDIRDRLVSLGTMRTFLDNAQASERYYFRPKMLQITSLYAEQLLPAEIFKKLGKTAKTADPPPPNSEAAPQKGASLAGKHVLLTLKGTYMVKRP